ncbi:hypothetical protein M6B38_288525 [Iris pallida]|uniref:Uncharacterized protein n=1 Tax=Iris pallida TaxID=29817 RepID=A0AAX6HXI8_IRIPA|nr:hypothetical protein M6B38_288525 [Iris pallida]
MQLLRRGTRRTRRSTTRQRSELGLGFMNCDCNSIVSGDTDMGDWCPRCNPMSGDT